MFKKKLLAVLLGLSLVIPLAYPAYAATPNMESFDIEFSDSLDTKSIDLNHKEIEKIPSKAARSAKKNDLRTFSVGLPGTVNADLRNATEWKPHQTIKEDRKEWRITFNALVNMNSANEGKVKILDDQGVKVPSAVFISSSEIKIKPIESYKAGTVYTLFIDGSLDSHKGMQLGKDVYLQFTYAPLVVEKPDITETNDLYSALYLGLKNLDDTIYVSQYTRDSKVAFAELNKVLEENPEIFYFQHKGSLFWSDGRLEAKYAYPKPTIRKMEAEMQREVNTLFTSTIKPGMSEYEKVKAIHDYVVLHTAYDYDNFKKNTVPKESYTMYGLLVNHTAVCQGYAETMIYLLNKLSIDTIYVRSSPAMNHAWNKVEIDGNWYNLDVTWDDPVPDRAGKIGYGYFLVSDTQLAKTHSWNNSGLPSATSTKYEYMSNFWTFDMEDGWIYYANKNDDITLYRMRADGSSNQKISATRANELVVYNGWIYFSNYSYGGYLFRMKTDGSSLTQMNNFLTSDISRENDILKYHNKKDDTTYLVRIRK